MIALALGVLAARSLGVRSARAEEGSTTGADGTLEVDVRGETLPRADDDTVPSTSVLEDDLDRPGSSLGAALSRVPGVMIARTGSASELTTMTLRGATSAQTPVYLAGVRLNDELSRAADLSTVPTFFLRRATVYRGHAPIGLDRTGLGGAVLLEPEIARGTRATAGVGAGSFGSRSWFGAVSAGDDDAGVAVAVRADRARNDYPYLDDRGTRFDESDDELLRRKNGDSESVDAWAALRMSLGKRGTWNTVVNTFRREQGVPGLGVIPAERARATTERALVGTRFRVGCAGRPDDPCAIDASTYVKRTRYTLRDPVRELAVGTPRQVLTTTSTGGALAYEDAPIDALETRIGLGHAFDDLIVDPAGPAYSHAERFSARAFGELEGHVTPWLDLRAAAAVSSERTGSGADDDLALVPSARVGASVEPARWLELFAAVAYYSRVPSLGELYGASASFLGNPALVPEAGPSADVGARTAYVDDVIDISTELVFYGRLADDLIEYKRNAAGTVRPYNVGSARVLGAEALAAARIVRMIELDASVAFTDARDVSEDRVVENDRLPFQAPWVATAGAALDLDDLGPDEWVSGARIDAQFLYRSPRFFDGAGVVSLPSQVLLDAGAGVRLVRDMLALDVRITNVLDDVTTDLVGYPLPGRAVYVELKGTWQ